MRQITLVLLLIGIAVGLSGESEYTELIVTVKNNQSIKTVTDATQSVVVKKAPNAPVYLLRASRQNDPAQTLADIRKISAVDAAEANQPIALASTDSSAPKYAALAHALADLLDGNARVTFYGVSVLKAYAEQPALRLIHATDVRGISTGAGSRVAYIDTGVDPYHPALQPWLEPGVDVINQNSTSEMDGLDHAMTDLLDHAMSDLLDQRFFFLLHSSAGDPTFPPAFGHGTIVAGLIHAVAPEARIFPIKAFDPYGRATMFAIVEGVYRAMDAHADVLNMSFSTNIDSPAFKKALDWAKASGMGITAAVGNQGGEGTDLYPAAYNSVHGVAATDADDKIAEFSNYGKTVKVSAPGVLVISTAPGGRYAIASGTSFSAPMVAGGIAVLSTRGRGLSDQALITTTADSIDVVNLGFEKKLGKGRINLARALRVN